MSNKPPRPDILLATTNKSKVTPFKKEWEKYGFHNKYSLITLIDLGLKDLVHIDEDTGTFDGDALKKALAYCTQYKLPTISLDRGIEFESLNNWPGTLTKEILAGDNDRILGLKKREHSRYKQDIERTKKLLDLLKDKNRLVYSLYGIAFVLPNGKLIKKQIKIKGTASDTVRITDNGYFYDWFFIPDGQKRTLSEMGKEEYLEYTSSILWPFPISVQNFIDQNLSVDDIV